MSQRTRIATYGDFAVFYNLATPDHATPYELETRGNVIGFYHDGTAARQRARILGQARLSEATRINIELVIRQNPDLGRLAQAVA